MTKVEQGEEVPSSIEGLQASYEKILQNQRVDLKDVERILPVTPNAEGMLVDSLKYLNVMIFKLKLEVDIGRLLEAWEHVFQVSQS